MIIIVDPDRSFRARVAEQLGRRPDVIEVDLVRQVEGLVAERADELSVILLGPGLPVKSALATAAKVQSTAPEVSVVLVAASLASEFLQSAMRTGIRDVLPSAFTPQQLQKAVQHAEALSRGMRERKGPTIDLTSTGEHKLVTVLSSKGGVGKSFVASNLAVLLARRGREVALVDLDLQFGDLAIMLQLFPTRTMCDTAQDLDRLDHEALRGYLTPHRSGVALLAAPPEPGLAETISAESVVAVLHMLKQSYPWVIVDTPSSFSDHVLAAIDESELLVSITTMDVPSIKNLRLSLQTLEMLGVGRSRMRVILNRADSKVGLNIGEVEKTLQTKVDLAIPSSREVPLSINRGTPIAEDDPKSTVTAALVRLTDSIEAETGMPSHGQPGRFHLGRKR